MATAFADRLQRAGMPSSTDHVARFVRASVLLPPATLEGLYWNGRITLVSEHVHLPIYDRVFDDVFRGRHDDLAGASRGDGNAPALPSPPQPTTRRSRHDGDDSTRPRREIEFDVALASREERLATTDFGELTDDELRELRGLMRQIRMVVPLRPARRHHRHRRGDRLDLRATLRRSRRTAGDPVDHVTRRARQRPRKVVVLCDISGSMAPYSRACIQMLHAAAVVGGTRAEVFSFATRLTRLTRVLAVAAPDAALARAAAAAPDWKGGTRIGSALQAFVDQHGRRGLARGAVVVILSDGWDRDDPGRLGAQMARLRRLAYAIVWINPRRSASDFAPRTGGMAAALPYCDALVSGNTLVALRDALDLTRRPSRPAPAAAPGPGPPGT